MSAADVMAKVGKWEGRADWQAWWAAHSIAANLLSVTDSREWERIAQAIEKFHERIKT